MPLGGYRGAEHLTYSHPSIAVVLSISYSNS